MCLTIALNSTKQKPVHTVFPKTEDDDDHMPALTNLNPDTEFPVIKDEGNANHPSTYYRIDPNMTRSRAHENSGGWFESRETVLRMRNCHGYRMS